MKPALTPEEWANEKWVRKEGQSLEAECWGSANVVALNLSQDGELIAQLWRTDRHALAALALYDQPEGFTREDITMLIAAANETGFSFLRSLADRIEALLPPE